MFQRIIEIGRSFLERASFEAAKWRPESPDPQFAAKFPVENGDLSTIDPTGEISNDLVHKNPHVSLMVPKIIQEKNRALCLPVLAEALKGSTEARALYESTRGINQTVLPTWGKEAIRANYIAGMTVFNPMEGVRGANKRVVDHAHKYKITKAIPYSIETEPLRLFATYAQAQSYLKLAAAVERTTPCVTTDMSIQSQLREYKVDFTFTAQDKTRAGAHFVALLPRIIDVAIIVQIIEDLCTVYQLDISDNLKRVLLQDCGESPWSLRESRKLKHLRSIDTLVKTETQILPDERATWIENLFTVKNPEKRLKELLIGASKITETTPPPRKAAEWDKAYESLSQREVVMEGISQALAIYNPNFTENGSVLRQMYALIRKGVCTYEQLLDAIRQKQDPLKIVAQIRKEFRDRNFPVIDNVSNQKTSATADDDLERDEQITVDASPVKDWLDTLDFRNAEIVGARIARLNDGNFGDCRRLAGGIVELRLHVGPGFRVYVWTASTNKLVVVHGGTKADQSNDIAIARQRVKELQLQ